MLYSTSWVLIRLAIPGDALEASGWLTWVTYLLAAVLSISIGFTLWVVLVLPAWVLRIGLAILVLNYRLSHDQEGQDALTVVG